MYIVWSLVRRRITRRLTRLQNMYNVLKYRKIFQNGALRLRCGCGYFFNLLKTSTVYHVLLCVFQMITVLFQNQFLCCYLSLESSHRDDSNVWCQHRMRLKKISYKIYMYIGTIVYKGIKCNGTAAILVYASVTQRQEPPYTTS